MTATILAFSAPPRETLSAAVAARPGTRVVALAPELVRVISNKFPTASFSEALREEHLVFSADQRMIRWASELFAALCASGGPPAKHRGIELDLMLEGRLKYYFFRRLALFYTKIEALLIYERPQKLILAADDPLERRLARDLALRSGVAFESIGVRAHQGPFTKEWFRRRPAMRHATLAAIDLLDGIRPRPKPTIEGRGSPVVLFAESYRHLDLAGPALEALQRRGDYPLLVAHLGRRIPHRPGLRARYAPLGDYLDPASAIRMLTAFRVRSLFPAPDLASAVRDREWRAVSDAALKEIRFAAFPFVVGLIERVKNIVETHHASLGVTLTELGAFGQTIARAGRRFGMKTLNIEHGIKTHDPMVERVIADRTAAFGEATRETLLRHGAEPDSVVLTGAPRYDALFTQRGLPSREEVLARLGIDSAMRVVVFASYPLGYGGTHTEDHKKRIVRALAEAVASEPRCALLVKLHPQESDSVAADALADFPQDSYRVVSDQDGPLYPLLSACDVLTTFTSTTALEAAILGKPVMVLNFSPLPDTSPYVREGVAAYVTEPGDVQATLHQLLDDPAARARLAEARAPFIRRYAYRSDGCASERVADLMEQMIAEQRAASRRTVPN
jgi:hypothetical protein